jgi:excreted virulence factor EspC (type VII ESX diderm)
MTDYRVDPDQLRAHAGVLTGYADRLAALGAGLPGSLAEQSLGSFAQFVTTGLGGAMTETLTAFGDVASTVDMVAGGVRQAAEGYRLTDGANATTISGIEGDL